MGEVPQKHEPRLPPTASARELLEEVDELMRRNRKAESSYMPPPPPADGRISEISLVDESLTLAAEIEAELAKETLLVEGVFSEVLPVLMPEELAAKVSAHGEAVDFSSGAAAETGQEFHFEWAFETASDSIEKTPEPVTLATDETGWLEDADAATPIFKESAEECIETTEPLHIADDTWLAERDEVATFLSPPEMLAAPSDACAPYVVTSPPAISFKIEEWAFAETDTEIPTLSEVHAKIDNEETKFSDTPQRLIEPDAGVALAAESDTDHTPMTPAEILALLSRGMENDREVESSALDAFDLPDEASPGMLSADENTIAPAAMVVSAEDSMGLPEDISGLIVSTTRSDVNVVPELVTVIDEPLALHALYDETAATVGQQEEVDFEVRIDEVVSDLVSEEWPTAVQLYELPEEVVREGAEPPVLPSFRYSAAQLLEEILRRNLHIPDSSGNIKEATTASTETLGRAAASVSTPAETSGLPLVQEGVISSAYSRGAAVQSSKAVQQGSRVATVRPVDAKEATALSLATDSAFLMAPTPSPTSTGATEIFSAPSFETSSELTLEPLLHDSWSERSMLPRAVPLTPTSAAITTAKPLPAMASDTAGGAKASTDARLDEDGDYPVLTDVVEGGELSASLLSKI